MIYLNNRIFFMSSFHKIRIRTDNTIQTEKINAFLGVNFFKQLLKAGHTLMISDSYYKNFAPIVDMPLAVVNQGLKMLF